MKGQTAIVSRADIEGALQKLEQNNRLSKQKRRYDDEEPEQDWHTPLDPCVVGARPTSGSMFRQERNNCE
jgi:hypothetical protein